MRLLYVSGYKFKKTDDGVFALGAYGNSFWQKYLEVFDGVDVLAEEVSPQIDISKLSQISDKRVSVDIIPANSKPKELKNDFAVRRALKEKIKGADAILVKQASRKGNMAIEYAEKYKKPYMIEMTGDMNLDYKTSNSILRKLYRPFLYYAVKRKIANCEFGLYVTQKYLQNAYPIKGKMFSCTDVVIDSVSESVLKNRIQRIDSFGNRNEIIVGLIGTYQNNRKGIDTAIKALSLLKVPRIQLHILGNGNEKEKQQWYDLAERYRVRGQLYFDSPVIGVENVFEWIDNTDINILPSRSEGLPRCIIEAMSRGCPCITSNVCGLPELISEEWLHDPNNDYKLAELMLKMISDVSKQKKAAFDNFEKSKEYQYDYLTNKRNDFLIEFRNYCIGKKKDDKKNI